VVVVLRSMPDSDLVRVLAIMTAPFLAIAFAVWLEMIPIEEMLYPL
jgi:hypothetical protein